MTSLPVPVSPASELCYLWRNCFDWRGSHGDSYAGPRLSPNEVPRGPPYERVALSTIRNGIHCMFPALRQFASRNKAELMLCSYVLPTLAAWIDLSTGHKNAWIRSPSFWSRKKAKAYRWFRSITTHRLMDLCRASQSALVDHVRSTGSLQVARSVALVVPFFRRNARPSSVIRNIGTVIAVPTRASAHCSTRSPALRPDPRASEDGTTTLPSDS